MNNWTLLEKTLQIMGDKVVTTKWLMANIKDINSVQKATTIMTMGRKIGKIYRYQSCQGPTLYITNDYWRKINEDIQNSI